MKIIAQVMGAIALINLVLSYQQENKKKFLVCQTIANIFYALQYICLNALSGFISSIISTLRSIIFYFYQKNNKNIPIIYLFIFIIITISTLLFTYDNIFSVIPVFITSVYTYGTWQKSLKLTYLIGVMAGILWVVYSYMVGAWVGILAGIFELVSSIIGYIRIKKV